MPGSQSETGYIGGYTVWGGIQGIYVPIVKYRPTPTDLSQQRVVGNISITLSVWVETHVQYNKPFDFP